MWLQGSLKEGGESVREGEVTIEAEVRYRDFTGATLLALKMEECGGLEVLEKARNQILPSMGD